MSYQATHNAIRTRFAAQWTTTPIAYPNVEFTPPAGDTGWVRLTIEDADAFQVSMGAPTNFYRHPGLIIVSVFVPLNRGDKQALEYADSIAAIFRSWQTTGIRACAPTVKRIGPDDKWYHVNVVVPFERDTLF